MSDGYWIVLTLVLGGLFALGMILLTIREQLNRDRKQEDERRALGKPSGMSGTNGTTGWSVASSITKSEVPPTKPMKRPARPKVCQMDVSAQTKAK